MISLAPAASAGLIIDPIFDSSITSSGNAAAIEGAINSAIGTIDGLYSNPVTLNVTFTYTPGAAGDLLSTNQDFYDVSYAQYVGLLTADSAANPGNTVLATAVANLGDGNDANGRKDLAVAGDQLTMLGITEPGNATININSNQTFAFSRPVGTSDFDAIGGLEHELDEVLGGGGAGSTLNSIADSCVTAPSGFFCNKVGPLDLYRYSADGTPSFSTSGSATSYLSIDGGLSPVVSFNQNSGGDYGDFAPSGAGPGQLIQNAFNTTGQDEAYTSSSPEFEMLESIGWDPSAAAAATPEPGTSALLGLGSAILALAYKRRKTA
jgi:hypothetical protein